MLFHTLDFALFLLAVGPLYLLLQRSLRAQNALLLVASYVFYGWWDWRFTPLLLLSTAIDYSVGLALARSRAPRTRNLLLLASCTANLALLGLFKYWDFFAATSNGIGRWLGFGDFFSQLHWLLPVGISFYTFQSMAYAIDVYRGRFEAWRSFPEFALYISFFPQLVAGPIERPQNLLRAIGRPRSLSASQIERGVAFFVCGWLVKTAADQLGFLCDPIYAEPARYDAWALLWANHLFVFQLYGDFLGYSQMARGLACLFGFELMANFDSPILASDIRDFWNRWHKSLTQWLRDYLYQPLRGRTGNRARVGAALFLTIFAAGVWHGAAWNFVAWGAFHGLLVAGHHLLLAPGRAARRRWLASRPLRRRVWHALCVFTTFEVLTLSVLLFRAQASEAGSSLENALAHLQGLARLAHDPFTPPVFGAWLVAIPLAYDALRTRAGGDDDWMRPWPWPLRGLAIALIAGLALVLQAEQARPFYYFQF